MSQSRISTSFVVRRLMSKECLLQWSIVMVVVILMSGIAEGSPDLQQLQPDSSLGRWFDRQAAMSNERSIQPELADDQGENEYLDAVLLREGLNGQVEPKKKPMQPRFPLYDGLRNRRRMLMSEEDRLFAKRDLNGMSMSITHNLDILRRGLLRELSLRQREQDRRHLMENNKKFLNGIGKRR